MQSFSAPQSPTEEVTPVEGGKWTTASCSEIEKFQINGFQNPLIKAKFTALRHKREAIEKFLKRHRDEDLSLYIDDACSSCDSDFESALSEFDDSSIEELDEVDLEVLQQHKEWNQVELDVNRTLARFPPNITDVHRTTLQKELIPLIVRVLRINPRFNYYQGFHDICLTVLLVCGVNDAFQVCSNLAKTGSFKNYLLKSLESSVLKELDLMYVILSRIEPQLEKVMRSVEVGSIFALSWPLTWFSHSLQQYQQIVRLFDCFLASTPLLPIYVSSAVLVYRKTSILACEREMPFIHRLLSEMPRELPIDTIIKDSVYLAKLMPPCLLKTHYYNEYRKLVASPPRSAIGSAIPRYALQFVFVAGTVGAAAGFFFLNKDHVNNNIDRSKTVAVATGTVFGPSLAHRSSSHQRMHAQQLTRKRPCPPNDDTPKRWAGKADGDVLPPTMMVRVPAEQFHAFGTQPEDVLFQHQHLQHVCEMVQQQQAYFDVPGGTPVARANVSFGSTASSSSQSTPSTTDMSPPIAGSFQRMPMSKYEQREKKIPEHMVYGQVPGRLAMVGNQTKYGVTIEELQRRNDLPECFNSSEMSSLLRKAKAKDSGEAMRSDLKARGIDVVLGKRHGCARTTFSSLTEGEATAMAFDLDAILSQCFPVQAIAENLAEQIAEGSPDLNQAYRNANAVSAHLCLLNNLLAVQPPVTGLKTCESSDPALNEGLKQCSLITHGFSDVAQRAFVKAFHRTFVELEKNLYLKVASQTPMSTLAANYFNGV